MNSQLTDEACVVCGSTDWSDDYSGEMRVRVCDQCGWPPPSPTSVEQYRALYESLDREPSTDELRAAYEKGLL